MKKHKLISSRIRALLFLLPLVAMSQAAAGESFKCQYVANLTDRFLKTHLSINSFTPEISRRALNNYLQAWDPGKLYFLQKDVDTFEEKFATKLPTMLKNNDCSAIDLIYVLYSQRFEERSKLIDKLIDSKFDFTKDEYFVVDRKSRAYATDENDLNDRWYKRIKYQLLQLRQVMKNDADLRSKLKKRYQLAAKRQQEVTTEDVYGIFVKSIALAFDPHSDYFSPSELEEFRIATRLSLDGIGALLRSEDGVTSVQSLVSGGAAQKSGLLKVGDKIVAVAQGNGPPIDVIDMDLRDVVKHIRGPGGSTVKLTVLRQNKRLVVPIKREKVQLEDRAVSSDSYALNEAALAARGGNNQTPSKTSKNGQPLKIGVIALDSFYIDFEGRQAHTKDYRSSSRDMLRELTKLKEEKVDAIILDLRMNGGGSLDEAITIGGLFIGKAPIVQIKAAGEKPYVSDYQGPAVYTGPLVVLNDRQSASASEILLGAIQDTQRGIIIGDTRSFGKGTVQNLTDIENNMGAIKVTISKFFRPSGASTQLKGVESDIVLPSLFSHFEIGEEFYDYALPWEQIESKAYPNFQLVAPHLPKLKDASSKRVATNRDFQQVEKYIQEYEQNKAERLRVSLQEKPNKKDKHDLAAAEEEAYNLKEQRKKDKMKKLQDDIYLQEALYIAADYVQLLSSKEPAQMKIVGLSPKPEKVVKDKKVNVLAAPDMAP